eukprot:4771882-Amphidinium_carterae.1
MVYVWQELAGGKTSDGVSGSSILDVKIEAVDQRTALAIGSANEVLGVLNCCATLRNRTDT